MTDLVTYRADGPIAEVRFDDGKANVMSITMLEALHAAFDRAKAEDAAVTLRGREGVFSAGFNLKVFAANDVPGSHAMVRAGAELALKVLTHPRPVLAVCTGHAFPMGAFLLLAADIRIGVDGPYRIGLNEVAIGIPVPSFGLELARQRLTPAYLNLTATTGQLFSPAEAAVAGFLDRTVAPDALDDAIDAAQALMLNADAPSHAIVKSRLRAEAGAAIRNAIDAEITLETYEANAARRRDVKLPG